MKPIGKIATPFTTLENMPIQPGGAAEVQGTITLQPEYVEGMKDLDGFSHIFLIYLFHKATREELTVIPYMDTEQRGVFATRSPLRPNHLGLSLVELFEVKDNTILIRGADILNGTPILDIKPFIPAFDFAEEVRTGWMTKTVDEVKSARADDRFV